jgi:hypothetical protein
LESIVMEGSPFATRAVAGGRGGAGELAGRAVLVVPLDGIWELHDKPWDETGEFECEDSYWPDDARSAQQFGQWSVEWVEHAQLADFISQHWPEFVGRGFENVRWEA